MTDVDDVTTEPARTNLDRGLDADDVGIDPVDWDALAPDDPQPREHDA